MKQGSLWLVGPDCVLQETESSGAHQRRQKKRKVHGELFTVNLSHIRSFFHGPTLLLQYGLGPLHLIYPIVVALC